MGYVWVAPGQWVIRCDEKVKVVCYTINARVQSNNDLTRVIRVYTSGDTPNYSEFEVKSFVTRNKANGIVETLFTE